MNKWSKQINKIYIFQRQDNRCLNKIPKDRGGNQSHPLKKKKKSVPTMGVKAKCDNK